MSNLIPLIMVIFVAIGTAAIIFAFRIKDELEGNDKRSGNCVPLISKRQALEEKAKVDNLKNRHKTDDHKQGGKENE